MKKFLYKNFRRLYKPIYVKRAQSKIDILLSSGERKSIYDQLIPDERHKYKSDIEQIKHIGLRLLRVLESICKKIDINYYLFYGTLLGAIRHKGFIPWDDDIDIAMTRNDFNKLLEHLTLFPNSVNVICMDIGFYKIMDKYSKISKDGKRGIAVDIFLLEDKKNEFQFHNVHKNYFNRVNKEWFGLGKRAQFESSKLSIPAKSESLLTLLYGNFMLLPKVEDRVYPHLGKEILILPYEITKL